MRIKSTAELAEFTRKQLKISGLTHRELSGKIGCHHSFISKAIAEKEKNRTARNGIRRQILELLGYEVSEIFIVKRQKKS
jgi:hypothetical protein